jgi:hypothetical protein
MGNSLLPQPFNAATVDPTQGAGQLPVGRHPVKIVDADITNTKEGNNGMAVLTLEILDGPMTGKRGPYRLNLFHSSETTSRIAQSQLSALCHVTGVMMPRDLMELSNRPFFVDVGLQPPPNDKGYTQVERVYDMAGNEPGKPANPQSAQVQQQPQQGFGGGQQAAAGFGGQQQQPQGGAAGWQGGAQQPQGQQPATQGGGWQGGGNAAPQQGAQAGGWQGGGQAQAPAPAPAQGGAQWAPNNGAAQGGGNPAPWGNRG